MASFSPASNFTPSLTASGDLARLGASFDVGSAFPLARVSSYATDFRDTLAATRRTVEIMRRLAVADRGTLAVQAALSESLTMITDNTVGACLDVIFQWIKSHVQFRPDEQAIEQGSFGRELLIAPSILLTMPVPMGDCDDFAMLSASMLMALGFRQLRFKAVAVDPNMPERLGHVYLLVYRNGEWISFDPSYGLYVGWEVQGITRSMEYEV